MQWIEREQIERSGLVVDAELARALESELRENAARRVVVAVCDRDEALQSESRACELDRRRCRLHGVTLAAVLGQERIAEIDVGEIVALEQAAHPDPDAILLALSGLKRLGLGHLPSSLIDPLECPPAPGQGALAIETRIADADAPWLAALRDGPTAVAVAAEGSGRMSTLLVAGEVVR